MPESWARSQRFDHRAIRRIAVFRALQLGDLLCAVPAFRALRHGFPRSRITLIGLPWAEEFVRRFTACLDDLLPFPGYPGLPEQVPDPPLFARFLLEARRRRFDLAIQMHGNGATTNALTVLLGAGVTAGHCPPDGWCPDPLTFLPYPEDRSEVHRLLALAEFLGAPARGDHLEFPVTGADRLAFASLNAIHRLEPHAYVCIHPGSQLPSRRWPADRFAAVGDALAARGYRIVLTGSSQEIDLTRSVRAAMHHPALDLAGRTTLGALAVLLDGARLLVSNDTGLSHLAAARRVSSVIVACGSDPLRWAPANRGLHRVVFEPVTCRPCAHVVCPIGHPCALGVSIDTVLAHVDAVLQATRPSPRDQHECAVPR